jgi:hypothetical protein
MVAARFDNGLRLKYLNLVARKEAGRGDKRKLIVAIACKILRIAFAVMKTKKPYDDDHVKSGVEKSLLGSAVDESSLLHLRLGHILVREFRPCRAY